MRGHKLDQIQQVLHGQECGFVDCLELEAWQGHPWPRCSGRLVTLDVSEARKLLELHGREEVLHEQGDPGKEGETEPREAYEPCELTWP